MNPCNKCERCSQYLNTDCIINDGDSLWWENVKNGSPRTLTSILESLPNCCEDLTSYIVTQDYTISAEDEHGILLLQGADDTEESTDTVSYTLTLPTDETLVGKVIRIKNISALDQFGQEMEWDFNQSIKYDWENNLSSTSYKVLAGSLHKVLWLTYVKTEDNTYTWLAISPNVKNLEVEEIEIEAEDMVNGWLPFTGSTVIASKFCKHVQLQGDVSAGDNLSTVFTLPVGWRPRQNLLFTGPYTGGSPWVVIINVLNIGSVQVSVIGLGGGSVDPTSQVGLSGVSFYLED